MGGHDLVALIFAREVSDPLTSLVRTIDKQLQQSSARRQGGNRLGVHVVFCSDDPGLQQQLQNLIAKEGLKHIAISLSANKSQGPPRYRVAREAGLTVVVYENRSRVAANYVLDSEDLTADRTNDILKSLRKVLP
ncbi:MAG: hypothetical protein L0Z62_09500 [Gemmataceae bacterium]|nr:hypothetical protein [Gemmataceae bacterium]